MLDDLGTGLGVDHDHDVVEARGVGIRRDEVDDALAVEADGSQLLYPSVATGATGREDDERRSAHLDHRRTADAHVIPAPKPVSSA